MLRHQNCRKFRKQECCEKNFGFMVVFFTKKQTFDSVKIKAYMASDINYVPFIDTNLNRLVYEVYDLRG